MSNPVDLLKSKGYSIFSDTKNDDCQITINANGINFSIKTVENMKCPPFVLCGINRETKMFSVASCPDESVEGALPFVKNGKPTTARVGISSVITKFWVSFPMITSWQNLISKRLFLLPVVNLNLLNRKLKLFLKPLQKNLQLNLHPKVLQTKTYLLPILLKTLLNLLLKFLNSLNFSQITPQIIPHGHLTMRDY